jgi:hypothetical protein
MSERDEANDFAMCEDWLEIDARKVGAAYKFAGVARHYILELRLERERREKAEAALNRIKYACKENDEESCAAGLFGEASAWRRVGLLAANALSPSLADGTGGGK